MANERLEIEFAQLSDPGRIREHNEDYLGHVVPASAAQARTHGWLFVLADGVGGQERGEVASRVAVESLLAGFRSAPAGEMLSTLLPRLVQAANTRVVEEGLAARSRGPAMATTLVTCALRFDRAVVAHVGDSRCYLIRRGEATVLTRDHTVASEQVRLGVLSRQEAAEAPTRHLLSRSLGQELFVSAEVSDHTLLPGDVLVLCSDGLHGALDSREIARIAAHHRSLEKAAQELVALANQKDGSDNISVQLARVRNVERVGLYRGRPYKL
ncbi:MAG TPA: protein phosphatase 2C domain-containing protein [Terriglobia bacterium]|nr:protein phosphatase 2C domain-containing protein [Terriglobia bacterium]